MIWVLLITIALIIIIIYFLLKKFLKVKAFIGFIGLNLLGNTIPIWFILLINIIENGIKKDIVIESIHQPFTFLVLGGTLLSTTLFLWQKDYSLNNVREISTLMIMYIFISLPTFGYLFVNTYNISNALIPNGHWIASYIVSFSAFYFYIKFQYKDFKIDWLNNNENTAKSQEKKRKKSFDNLNESFDNFIEDGE
jgi:hypothetical protein